MTKHHHSEIPFITMCRGPNPEQERKHREAIEFHEMMERFYRLTEGQQKTFMVYFQSLHEE